jgi:hypothetical protein
MGIPGESASQRPALPPRGPSADPITHCAGCAPYRLARRAQPGGPR